MNPDKLFFSKDKFIGQKKSFRIVVDGSKITLYSPVVYLPFGIEIYNGKHILNFEVETERNNDLYNFYALIYKMENILQNLGNNEIEDLNIKSNHQQIANLIKGKQFVPCIKNGLKGYLIRSYVNKGVEIKSNDGNNFFTMAQTKGKLAKVTLEIGNLWIMPDTYGYILNITDIIII
jgi:hypothetical protein